MRCQGLDAQIKIPKAWLIYTCFFQPSDTESYISFITPSLWFITSVLLHHLWEISSNIPSGSYFINLNEAHIGAYRFCIQFYVETRGNDALLVENEGSHILNIVK